MVVAVTGASGHIGINICCLLAKAGYHLKLLINQHKYGLEELNAEFFIGNILDTNAVDKLIQGSDFVIHLAARISIEGDKDDSVKKINVQGTSNIIEASIKCKVKKLLYFSSIHTLDPFPLNVKMDESRAYTAHPFAYEATKIAAEKLVLNARIRGLKINIICPTAVFGPNDYYPSLLGQAIKDIYSGKIPALTKGGYDFLYVEDLARGAINILENGIPGEKYILSGIYLSIKEFATLICSKSDKKIPKVVLPFWFLNLLLPIFKLMALLSSKKAVFTKESFATLKNSNRCISSEKAESQIGYVKTPIHIAISETIKWFQENSLI